MGGPEWGVNGQVIGERETWGRAVMGYRVWAWQEGSSWRKRQLCCVQS